MFYPFSLKLEGPWGYPDPSLKSPDLRDVNHICYLYCLCSNWDMLNNHKLFLHSFLLLH